MTTFAERLKKALDKLNISQAEAARRCGVTQQSINYIISNNLKASKLAVKIAASLDINPNWLIYGEGNFVETKYYEIPVFDNVYDLLKYSNNDLDKATWRHVVIDIYLGDLAFAFLVDSQKLAICCQKEYNDQPIEFLCIIGAEIQICKEPCDSLSFSIIEWRSRRANFNFS